MTPEPTATTRYLFHVQTGVRYEQVDPPTDEEWASWLADGTVDADTERRTEPKDVFVMWADCYVDGYGPVGGGHAGHYRMQGSPASLTVPEVRAVVEERVVAGAVSQWMQGRS